MRRAACVGIFLLLTSAASAAPKARTSAPPPSRGKWAVLSGKDAMTDRFEVELQLRSDTVLPRRVSRFRPALIVTCGENGPLVFVETGTVTQSNRYRPGETTVTTRFDKEEATANEATEILAGRFLSLNWPRELIEAFLLSRTLRIRFAPYQELSEDAVFDLRGFSRVLPSLKRVCKWEPPES